MLAHLEVLVVETGSSGSDKRACRSSKVYGLSWKEIRVDVWGVLGSCRWCRFFFGMMSVKTDCVIVG